MSIPIIEKHTMGGRAYLRPADLEDEQIKDHVFRRERFSEVTELLRRLDRIDEEDFSEVSNKYFISAEHINDAYIAVLAIYWTIAGKLDNIGELIVFDEEKELPLGGFPVGISITADMGGDNVLNVISSGNNPVIHTVSSAAEADREILFDNCIEFFVSCSGKERSAHALKKPEGCCRCVSIEADKSEDAGALLTDYFFEKDYEYGDAEKEINTLVRRMNTHDEYVITAAARQVVSNHLFNDPDSRELSPQDFRGVAELFSAKKDKHSVNGCGLVGLERETAKINGVLDSISFDKLRYDRGISDSFNGFSMVFAGPPGTAKTTLARLFADRLAERGLIKNSSCFKECVKSDIVGQFVGHTAARVDGMFAKMAEEGGGVIFFDEIYTLSESDSTTFDREAITCITQNMENYRNNVFCIFAGYENKMNEFLASNPGLRSRISFTVKFSGYSDDALCSIFRNIAAADSYKVPEGCEEVLRRFFKQLRRVRGEQFGNGREARNLFVNAKLKHSMHISSRRKVTSKMLTTLEPEDISEAVEDILSSELGSGVKRNVIGF